MIRVLAMTPALWLAGSGLACPVCGGGGPNRQAYIDTMVFMSAMPLLMLGGVALFFWWKSREVVAPDDSVRSSQA